MMRILFLSVILLLVLPIIVYAQCPTPITHYVAPNGAGNGSSAAQPTTFANVWQNAWRTIQPGDVICAAAGLYQGADNMADMHGQTGLPADPVINGTLGNPVTIACADEATRCVIDGQGVRRPFRVFESDYITVQGFDFHSSSADALFMGGTSSNRGIGNIVQRVVAWDSNGATQGSDNGNYMCFSFTYQDDLFVEDSAGFGQCRKVFSPFRSRNPVFLRVYGKWQHGNMPGPKMAHTNRYHTENQRVYNGIYSWDQTYDSFLLECDPPDFVPDCGTTVTRPNQPYGGMAYDGSDAGLDYRYTNKGSLFYLLASDKFDVNFAGLYFLGGDQAADTTILENIAVGFAPGATTTNRTLWLGLGSATTKTATNLTVFGRPDPDNGYFTNGAFTVTNLDQGATVGDVASVWKESGAGAQICKRYDASGNLTAEPLFPWPMQGRILAASADAAAKNPTNYYTINLEADLATVFGAIAAACTASSGGSANTTLRQNAILRQNATIR